MGDGKNVAVSGVLVAAVVVLALVVKGGQPGAAVPPPPAIAPHDIGAIVIEKQRLVDSGNGGKPAVFPIFETLTETSRSGNLVATYSSVPSTTGAQQEVNIGNSEEIYDPHDDTIYETTFQAIAAAQQRLLEESLPKGSEGSSSTDTQFTYGSSASPGWTSEYAQDVRDHNYRVAGETTIDGRAALELIPKQASRADGTGTESEYEALPTVYVSPNTYDPIRSVTSVPAHHGFRASRFVTDWLEYKVIPATAANRRLLSLTALHPTATISRSAMAYARATTPPGPI